MKLSMKSLTYTDIMSEQDSEIVELKAYKAVVDLIAKDLAANNQLGNQEGVCEAINRLIKERDAALKALREARPTVEALCSGIDIIPWGKVKAHLPTDLAKMLTGFNVKSDKALALIDEALPKEGE